MNYFYETPRLPMFMLMEEMNLTRVRALRFCDGKLDGVLADWDVCNLQTEFYPPEHWNEESDEPFYCIYKSGDDYVFPPYASLKAWASEMAIDGGCYEYEIFDEFLSKAKEVGCPIFDSIEEARDYIFERKKG